MGAVLIALNELTADAGINPRAGGVNAAHAADITEFLTQNPKRDTPPAVVYRDPADCTHWLSEGFHRHAGYRDAGRTHIPCEVRDGDRTAALLNAVASNQSHGLKRSPEDKRLAVRLVLAAEPDWSDRRIADHIGVGYSLVADVRKELSPPQVPDSGTCEPNQVPESGTCEPRKRVGKDGKTYKVPAKKPKKTKPETQQPEPVKQDESADCDEGDESTPAAPDVKKAADTVDTWGIPIQPHAAEAFAAAVGFDELLRKLAECARDLNALVDSPAGGHLLKQVQWVRSGNKAGGNWILAHLDNTIRTIKSVRPAVTDCPYAFDSERKHPENCPLCHNLRWTGSLKAHQIPPVLSAAMKAHYGVQEGKK